MKPFFATLVFAFLALPTQAETQIHDTLYRGENPEREIHLLEVIDEPNQPPNRDLISNEETQRSHLPLAFLDSEARKQGDELGSVIVQKRGQQIGVIQYDGKMQRWEFEGSPTSPRSGLHSLRKYPDLDSIKRDIMTLFQDN